MVLRAPVLGLWFWFAWFGADIDIVHWEDEAPALRVAAF